MKNLNFEKMEKVNGGDQCDRVTRRLERAKKNNKGARVVKLTIKQDMVC